MDERISSPGDWVGMGHPAAGFGVQCRRESDVVSSYVFYVTLQVSSSCIHTFLFANPTVIYTLNVPGLFEVEGGTLK